MSEDDEANEKLAGRTRAIEAILAELPQVTIKVIDAAEDRLKAKVRGKRRSLSEAVAELKEKAKMPLDEHGEAALNAFRYEIEKRSK